MIKIYTQQNCPECEQAKIFFDTQQIPFEVFDITHNEKLKKYVMFELGVYHTPVIVIQDIIIPGFQKERITSLLCK